MIDAPGSDVELYVLIVNWRTPTLTVDCLRSVETERSSVRLRAIVVDNASGDDSVDRIRSAIRDNGWQDWAEVIPAPRNGGFAYGNNLAIRSALAHDPDFQYVLLLNPDTVVRRGAFRVLLDFMNNHPEAGTAGGISEDPDGTRQHCSFRFPTILGELAAYARTGMVDRLLRRWTILAGKPADPEEVDWVSGAYLIVRRQVIDDIGIFDESYFLYFEETDFLLRARRAGWRCWHVPGSRVVHLVGQSSGVTDPRAKTRPLPQYWFESRRRYFILNHGRSYAIAADMAVMLGHGIWRIRRILQRRGPVDPPNLISGILRFGALRNGRSSLKARAAQL